MKLLTLVWLWFECLVKEIFLPLCGGIIFGRVCVWILPYLTLFEEKAHLSVWGYLLVVAIWMGVLRKDMAARGERFNRDGLCSFTGAMAMFWISFFTLGLEQKLAVVCGSILILHDVALWLRKNLLEEKVPSNPAETDRV